MALGRLGCGGWLLALLPHGRRGWGGRGSHNCSNWRAICGSHEDHVGGLDFWTFFLSWRDELFECGSVAVQVARRREALKVPATVSLLAQW
jgi:hypothetical protein